MDINTLNLISAGTPHELKHPKMQLVEAADSYDIEFSPQVLKAIRYIQKLLFDQDTPDLVHLLKPVANFFNKDIKTHNLRSIINVYLVTHGFLIMVGGIYRIKGQRSALMRMIYGPLDDNVYPIIIFDWFLATFNRGNKQFLIHFIKILHQITVVLAPLSDADNIFENTILGGKLMLDANRYAPFKGLMRLQTPYSDGVANELSDVWIDNIVNALDAWFQGTASFPDLKVPISALGKMVPLNEAETESEDEEEEEEEECGEGTSDDEVEDDDDDDDEEFVESAATGSISKYQLKQIKLNPYMRY